MIALSILSLLVWLALDAGPAPQRVRLQTVTRAEWRFAAILFGLIFLQAGLGALVAGLKAGHTYNTWPLMDGRFVPEGLGQLAPWYLNVFENVTTVQFDHRMVAYLVVALALWHVVALRRSADDERLIGYRRSAGSGAACADGIGIATLLAGVPIALGLAHQAGAAIAIAAATAASSRNDAGRLARLSLCAAAGVEPEHQPDVLHGRTGGALAEVVEPRNQNGLAQIGFAEHEDLQPVGAVERLGREPRHRRAGLLHDADQLGAAVVLIERKLEVAQAGFARQLRRDAAGSTRACLGESCRRRG